MEKDYPLVLITKTKYAIDLIDTNYVEVSNTQTTVPLGNTEIIRPEYSDTETDVLAVAIIELTNDPNGPAAVAFLITNQQQMDNYLNGETNFPPVGISMLRNSAMAFDFLIDYAEKWLVAKGMNIEDIEEADRIIVNDIRKGDSDTPEDIKEDLATIHEGSFDVTFTFLHSSLVFLLTRYTHREQIVKNATHETTRDELN